MNPWIDLTAAWQITAYIAELHNKEKNYLSSTRAWAGGSAHQAHWYGLLGEIVYGLATDQPVDFEVHAGGDGGTDFADGCDVKTVTFYSDPWLKVPIHSKHWSDRYAVVALNVPKKCAQLVGYATLAQVVKATQRNWGFGPQYSIPPRDLI